jgi:hypothetical protein
LLETSRDQKNSDKPCSFGVVRDSKGLKGDYYSGYYYTALLQSSMLDCHRSTTVATTTVVNAGLPPLYYSGPKDVSGEKFGVVVLSDVCGSNVPNPKYIADYLADNGFHAALPDQFHRKDPAAWAAT